MLRNCSRAQPHIMSSKIPQRIKMMHSSASYAVSSYGPNAPLELDTSMQELLKNTNISMKKHKYRNTVLPEHAARRELEVLEFDESWVEQGMDEDFPEETERRERKSARAAFGSRGIGSVYIPLELRDAIERVIHAHDKPSLHEDAKRLFRIDASELWHTQYEPEYKSHKQASRHLEGDGVALASVALPAHYSSIFAVLDNVKHRLGDNWEVRHVFDWGSGVGSALWASMHALQRPEDLNPEDPRLSQSTIRTYLGIDKRNGLSAMAQRLLKGIDIGATDIRWRRGLGDGEKVTLSEGSDVLALSAFHLSSISSPVARKEVMKQIWSSGANVIVLIDHDSPSGFEAIAEARDYLLHLGKKELDESYQGQGHGGCHVVAPCPHDGACPLYHPGSSKLICSFSQRMQRPAFLRRAKDVRAGHEDIGYTYVVIKRGQRPVLPTNENDALPKEHSTGDESELISAADSEQRIRLEAYNWPRLVFPPLKRSGHIILDACTMEGRALNSSPYTRSSSTFPHDMAGQIIRMTIPRSQGKQPFYDARKSSWGDIFPHKPKNQPQIRVQPSGKDSRNPLSLPGADIGKRGINFREKQKTSYSGIMEKAKGKKAKKGRNRYLE